jgi:outer membrane protein OmpA-like peptidoglycan-associated protein
MKVKHFWLFLIMACQLIIPASQAQPAVKNSSLSYYCGNEDVEFKEQVTVGLATRVHQQEGAFYQLQEIELYKPAIDLIKDEIQNTGVSEACAEYLLTQGTLGTDNALDILARVYFNFDSAELTQRSRYVLDNLLEILAQDNKQISVIGHTDNSGSEKYNFSLGLKRSKEVEAYLVNKGIDPAQLSCTSNGPSQQINANANATERQANRRVEIIK